jgi:alkyl sulfatase BDS1-like metallo-beta-lactamase superfamily hydrolase
MEKREIKMKSKIQIMTFALSIMAVTSYAQEVSPYMGGDVKLTTAPNGAIVREEVLKIGPQISYTEPTIDKVAEGVWAVGGYSLANTTVIEGDDGLIVYDTGDTREEAEHIRKAIESISDKPIKVIIYSHSHYAMGAGALVDNPEDVLVVGHPKVNETVESSLQGGGAPSAIPEVGPILTARTMSHFGLLLPEEGPDAGVTAKLDMGKPVAFLPATKTVEDGEELEVLGIKLQFFTEYMSDDYNLTVWVPEKKAVLNNFLWPGTPNLYTLRGGVYRSPLVWRDGLKVIRDLQPEILLNTHARALVGKEKVMETLTLYMDMITFTYDQTLRGIMRGMGPDELRHFVTIPPHFNEIPENFQGYGESVHFPEAIYQYVIGWFDWDSTKLFKIAPKEAALRTVRLMGGKKKVIKATRAAFDKKEFAWAAELVQNVYLLDANDKEVRQLKADILRQLAYRTTGSISRGFLLSEAQALEGKIKAPLFVLPSAEIIAGSPATFVDYYRIYIDPDKSKNTDKVIEFVFTDHKDQSVALHIRRGVVEFVPEPSNYLKKADFVLKLDGKTWAELYLNSTTLGDAIASGKVKVKGEQKEVAVIFEMFDKFEPAKNYLVPPIED